MANKSAWDTLAEALGITEINWNAVNKRRQMQQNGSMDRRNQQGPMPYFKTPAMQQRAQNSRPIATNPNAMAQIPAGTDVPGQVNPLFAPPGRPKPKSPLATAPNSPQSLGGEDDEGDGPY